ncbi:hypothetical protein P4H65_12050 [Paenibacillus chitinolyticus]|nr:hypothetical protein [Paenibacillus chitinolyticus]MEC0246520.1 hypothetical protein [Paenibacillus chitinolyticus]
MLQDLDGLLPAYGRIGSGRLGEAEQRHGAYPSDHYPAALTWRFKG